MDPVDEIMTAASSAVEGVMNELLVDVAKELDKDLSVEVGRDGKGRVVQRSLPGEYPRWETKRFRLSVTNVVYRTKDVVHGLVSTNTPYDEKLNATRPFQKLTESKWQRRAETRFALSLK